MSGDAFFDKAVKKRDAGVKRSMSLLWPLRSFLIKTASKLGAWGEPVKAKSRPWLESSSVKGEVGGLDGATNSDGVECLFAKMTQRFGRIKGEQFVVVNC